MRIAHVVSSYHPRIGGVETHVRRIAEACAAAGDEVTVLTHATGATPAIQEIGAVRVLRFPETIRSVRYPLSLPLFHYLAEHAGEFELAHAHSYHTLVGHAARRSGLPFVFTPHYHGIGHTPAATLMHRVYRPLGGWVLARADAVICVSQAEQELLLRDFPSITAKTQVIPNGTELRAPVNDRRRPAPSTAPVLLTVGRLLRYKNVDLIIKAFAQLQSDATMAVVGDGPDRARLEQVARETLLVDAERVRFAGRVSDAELANLLATADVVTSASDHEAFGLVVADGLTAGARVVASAIPAHQEIARLAGPAAPITFVDPRQTDEYAIALAAGLTMGRASEGRAWLPSWANVARQTRELYARIGLRDPQVRCQEPV